MYVSACVCVGVVLSGRRYKSLKFNQISVTFFFQVSCYLNMTHNRLQLSIVLHNSASYGKTPDIQIALCDYSALFLKKL